MCPGGEGSWCSWQQVLATDTSSYTHDYLILPADVAEAIYPIYEDLSNLKLLERCVGGFTQNNNESYNRLIWKITSKIAPCGSKVVEIAAYIAARIFNEGKIIIVLYECIRTFIRHRNSCLCQQRGSRACDDLRREKEEWLDDKTSWTY
ncbi:uncharacterized protein TNIN_72081 [Trichonephila inaurata madagascariensis]|uniref:Uncharacterized protein n=1 Tax=Trichonephila inaurata madagascariensis TaxID=2747483 RepID=A0A8X7C2P5_9ARAC|nr:uncharacterized protein TNIN_72081 [Trichonephila inaurata madagascariensis]